MKVYAFSENLKRIMHRKGWTCARLATELEVSEPTVCSWRNDKQEPKAFHLFLMAQLFGMTLDELVTKEERRVHRY